jgi:hypothetical protein
LQRRRLDRQHCPRIVHNHSSRYYTAPDVEITEAVHSRDREIADRGTTNMRYIEITFEAIDAVGVDKTEYAA